MSEEQGSGSPMSERMQSLLSRAVEDQLTEQRQLAGVLGEVHAQLTRIDERIGSLHAGAAGAAPVEQGLAGIATDLREAVRVLAERLDGVGRLVQQRGHDLSELKAMVAQLRETVDAQGTGLSGLTGGLGALPAFGDRIETLQTGLAELSDRLRGLEEIGPAIGSMQQRADAHDAGLRDLRQAFTGVAARAAQLPGREDVDGMLGRVGEAVEALGNRLARLESAVPSMLERLDGVADAVERQGTDVEEVRDRIGDLSSQRSAEGAAVDWMATVERALVDLRQRMDAVFARSGDGDAVDDVVERLDALTERLFGDGGLQAEVAARAEPAETDDGRVEEIVARAVEDSERRLADHVDQAVLALAEVLVRRRGGRPGRVDQPFPAAAPVAVAPAVAPAAGEIDDDAEDEDELDNEDQLDAGDEDEGPESTDAADTGEDADDHEPPDDHEDGGVTYQAVAPWQTPPAPAVSAESPEPAAAEPEPPSRPAKRKPWWRPGD